MSWSLHAVNGLRILMSFPCDLSSLTEVRNAIDHVKVHYQKLDMLINNAGLWNTKQIKTVDGIEQTWQVNLLVPYLLMKEFQPSPGSFKITKNHQYSIGFTFGNDQL